MVKKETIDLNKIVHLSSDSWSNLKDRFNFEIVIGYASETRSVEQSDLFCEHAIVYTSIFEYGQSCKLLHLF